MPLPKKNTAYSFVIGLVDQASRPSFKANPTLASGDFKHSGDGSALTNLTDLPTVDPAAGRLVKITLTAAEMNYDRVTIQCVDAAGSEWDDVIVYIDTTTRNVDDLCFPTVSGRSLDVSAGGEAGVDWANVGTPGSTVNLSATTVKTATDVETDTADIQSRLPAALGANGNIKADVRDYSGTAGTFSGGRPEVNTTHWGGTAVASAVVGANVAQISGDATAADNLEAALDGTGGVTLTASITGSITGNLSGNVGGNVTGSVGSLATQAKADVQAEAEEALQTYHLDHLIASADPGAIVANSSLWAALTSKSATPAYSSYSNQTDSLEALRDRGDAAWITATGFSTHSAADVWSAGTRTLTAATNITSTGGTITVSSGSVSVYDFTTAAKALLQTEAEDALITHRLDELLNADSDIDGAAPPTVGSVFHELMSKTAGSFTFDQTTDSLEALRDRGDAAWITATGFSTLDAAGVRAAVGLASANLDAQLDTLPTANENADALLDRTAGVETNRTLRQALRFILATSVGKLSGAATTTITIRDTNDSVNRVVATVDADGNRSAITLDGS